ncbi:MAG: polysaccharide deacetylase family protein [Nitrospirae bacterium]|nr:polysaccharide deacetylase family protein [Nitrospirota bacterium]
MKLLTLSIDVDTLAEDLYEKELTRKEKEFLVEVSFRRIIPRVINFLNNNGIKATFFLIGKYAGNYQDSVLNIFKSGNEIGNHTFSHHKNFSRLGSENIASELRKCHEVISQIIDEPPVGFRAPGYTINSTIMKHLRDMGYYYDTSIIPSWSYQSLKKIYRLFIPKAKKDFIVPQELACALAPQSPYKFELHSLFKKSGNSSFYEIPVSVLPLIQIPYLNAIQLRILPAFARLMDLVVFQRSFVNINFHDIEFAVSEDFGNIRPGLLVRNYVKIPLEQRLDRMNQMIRYAQCRNFQIMNHREVINIYRMNEV